MHPLTQRQLCRVLFVALCLAPTVGLALCAAWRGRPGAAGAWARRLEAVLGARVQFERVSHPRPGVLLLHGLQVLDPETGRLWARARLVERIDGSSGGVLLLAQPEVTADGLPRLCELLLRPLTAPSGHPSPVRAMRARELTLHDAVHAQTLHDVHWELISGDAPQWIAEFRLPEATASSPAGLRLSRDRSGAWPTTRLELQTGPELLPCSLISLLWPAAERLGPQARFTGQLWFTLDAAREGELRGSLVGVDLDRLLSDQFPHKLTGTAQVTVDHARLQNGRLTAAAGSLAAGPGTVSQSLLDAAVRSLRLEPAPELAAASGRLEAYDQLALRWEIDGHGLTLRAPPAGRGVLMTSPAGPLLRQPALQPLPAVSLVRTLVPQSDVQVPATLETDRLLRWLPIPPVVRPTEAAPRQADVRVRLSELKQR